MSFEIGETGLWGAFATYGHPAASVKSGPGSNDRFWRKAVARRMECARNPATARSRPYGAKQDLEAIIVETV
jgi:hypothetical protein